MEEEPKMSVGDTHRNVGELFKAATLEVAKVTLIKPWQVDAGQELADRDLDECGCAFCPEDEQKTI